MGVPELLVYNPSCAVTKQHTDIVIVKLSIILVSCSLWGQAQIFYIIPYMNANSSWCSMLIRVWVSDTPPYPHIKNLTEFLLFLEN